MGGRDSFLIIRRVGMACQARGRKVRIIHHRESLYHLPSLRPVFTMVGGRAVYDPEAMLGKPG
jgi:hypothetical protein